MIRKIGSKEILIENLKDAGCDDEQIKQFIYYVEHHDFKEQLTLLKCQRCSLLERLHSEQKKMDCLDYLIYKIKKESTRI